MAGDVFGIVGTTQADAFRVDAVVAEGGFAVIYRAYHELFRADVALKCLKVPGNLQPEKQAAFLERFRAEAELLFRLSASIPSIVRPLHVGTLTTRDGQFAPFIALEWLNGKTLAEMVDERLESGQVLPTVCEVVELLSPVAHALERAHNFPGPDGKQSVLHRDLKPDNIFIAMVHGEQLVKILDFGIAKVKRAATQIVGRHSIDRTSISAFTPSYAAPEQWLPKRFGQTGPWTDVWGLALTAVEACCGRPPLEGDATSIMGSALDEAQRPTPRSLGVRVGDAVERIFARALAVDPRKRYQSVAEFWTALESAAGARPSHAVLRSPRHESLPPEAIEAAERLFGTRGAKTTSPVLRAAKVPQFPGFASAVPTLLSGSLPSKRAESSSSERLPEHGEAGTPDRLRQAPRRSSSPNPLGAGIRHGVRELDEVETALVPELAVSRPELQRERAPVRSARPSRNPMPLVCGIRRSLGLLTLAVAIMGVDWAYTSHAGQGLAFGPVRPLWLAGPMAVIAVAMMVYCLITAD